MARTRRSLACAALIALASACGDRAVDQQALPVVYGMDDRTDVYAHPSAALRALAQRSVVALIYARNVDERDPSNVTFSGRTLGDRRNLCPGERFASDPTSAYCSGTLIDDDLVLTAGHCIDTAAECADTRLTFSYYRDSASTLARATSDDVFRCAAIVTRADETLPDGTELDYQIIRLDRAATPRFAPATVRMHGTVTARQPIAVIGFGSGIPAKIDSGGTVTDPRAGFTDYFEANTDTFGGNSGSGVFDITSNELIGILVRGATDYVATDAGCNVVNVCPSRPGSADCEGESVSHVQRALDAFCASNASARLCPAADASTDASTDADADANTDSGASADASENAADANDAAVTDAAVSDADASDADATNARDASLAFDASDTGAGTQWSAGGGLQCSTTRAPTGRSSSALAIALVALGATVRRRRQR